MKLTCDICQGELVMLSGTEGARCKDCGVTYDIGTLREKLGVKEQFATKTNTTINNVVTDDIPVAEAYEASFVSQDDTKTKEAPKKETPPKSAPKKEKPKMKTITFKRKRDLFICKVKVLIDDEDEYILNGQGKETTIKVTKGIHKINVFVASSAGIQELEEKTIEVGDYNYYGEIGLYRGAFKAAFGYKIWEVK